METPHATADAYLDSLPEDRQSGVRAIRDTILKHLPDGFVETMAFGMISYVVPHDRYPAGYHCDSRQPLPFMGLGVHKNHIVLHHLGLYADSELYAWLLASWPRFSKRKPDLGKGCIRFKNPEQAPLELIGQLASRMLPEAWIRLYEAKWKR